MLKDFAGELFSEYQKSVQNFSRNVNKNLQVIHDRMIVSPPVLSKYIQFKIYDPKERMISVVPFCGPLCF